MKIPQHIAIILDGNGRWAKAKGMPRTYGHTVGAKNVENICRAAGSLGVRYITVYAFSTENWNRPADEVETLMKLLGSYLNSVKKTARKDNLRVRFIGERSRLEQKLQDQIRDVEEFTENFDGLILTIAVNYGSRDEIVRAVRRIEADRAAGLIEGEVTEKLISEYLDTAGIPDPDLMIRTSGELRLSNYLLWQLAYSEFYFTPVPWPDFNEAELKKAIEAYNARERRFGGLTNV